MEGRDRSPISSDAAADPAQQRQQRAASDADALHQAGAGPSLPAPARQSGQQPDEAGDQQPQQEHNPEAAQEEEEEEDELDRLTAQYEAQAAAAAAAADLRRAAVARRAAPRPAAARRAEALATPLAADNKGYMLLAKMGFQGPGQGLGRERQGRAEPLPLTLKAGRAGLGVEEGAAKRKREAERRAAEQASKRQAHTERAQQGFKGAQADAYALRRLRRHIGAAEAAARSLDERAGVEANPLLPPLPATTPAAAATEPPTASTSGPDTATATAAGALKGEESRKEAAAAAGGGLSEEEEDRGGCCGASRHAVLNAEAAAVSGAPVQEEGPLGPEEARLRLDALVDYLRSTYAFCVFCGTHYEGQEDMAAHCPGPGEEDHDG